ncbi:hypothetical protein ABOM_007252 [Aspergillus bombycis]|uniref:Uncharacterized protein n=1 Tax=Aspergillus bombycis TaxID=109264 RepID=A0A1F7ZXY0_9EURO|nr:hypothetical protein ABOM_007252 [Aspergillus bombycis]OGM44333.1 hypothetical protein ABOM_007252 [Aspergillus bombycis]
MESFDLTNAPPEIQAYTTLMLCLNLYNNASWLYVYFGMIYRSIKDKSYAMPLYSQCLNIAWELTFGLMFIDDWKVCATFIVTLPTNCLVIWAAISHGAREWGRSPLVQRHLLWFYVVGTVVSVALHMCAASELGPEKAFFVDAIVCQAVLSVGYLGNLIHRGSTRGFSMDLWFFRFSGSLTLVPEFYLRVRYWPEKFGFLGQPLMLWCCAVFLGFDLVYGIYFWYIQRQERETGMLLADGRKRK